LPITLTGVKIKEIMRSFIIRTEAAAYGDQKVAEGFSRILDQDGNHP